ncbi:hypothetical protein FQN57_002997 [Myotisia sp. PD_48]|nr:hypothetical protein FQN57_002997 [Myotisia sp. PD_48]
MLDRDYDESSQPRKRSKTSDDGSQTTLPRTLFESRPNIRSLNRSITPPPSRQLAQSQVLKNISTPTPTPATKRRHSPRQKIVPSPVHLTHIRDIPGSTGYNKDAVKLQDLIGDPMIKECWQFNYLHDVDFILDHLDPDVRSLVQLYIVHGSWKREAPNRISIDEACNRYQNVESIVAYMPEPFGTHHSKMMVLVRHDDLAQVIIHTANMIAQDWRNMCQAVWLSPLLPLLPLEAEDIVQTSAFGSGARFQRDLLAYLKAYKNKKIGLLISQLSRYDFSAIKATLVASVPSRQPVDSLNSESQTIWGWPSLKDTVSRISMNHNAPRNQNPHVVIQVRPSFSSHHDVSRELIKKTKQKQVSSIATLGQTDKWLKDTFFNALIPQPSVGQTQKACSPRFSIIFPTPDEIRRSLDGYISGGSIHMKIQSAAQQKQLAYLRNYLCHWAGDTNRPQDSTTKAEPASTRRAGRRRAAPHIKTYIQFSDQEMKRIDWAMVTSANLSTQAWGAGTNTQGEVRICSWEIGVVVWAALFKDEGGFNRQNNNTKEISQGASVASQAEMVPCFGSDLPSSEISESDANNTSKIDPPIKIGFRMPYDLPLTPYASSDVPWCATASHTAPDWMGQLWDVE